MKKFFTVTLLVLSLIVFTACGDSKTGKKGNTSNTDSDQVEDDSDVVDTDSNDDKTDTVDTDSDDDKTDTVDTDSDDDKTDTVDTDSDDDDDADTDPDIDPDTDVPECTGLSLDLSALTHYQTNKFYVTNNDYDPVLRMEFYQDEETGKITAGTYDLGSEINASFKTCTECVMIQADLVGEGEEATYSKVYYQKSGELKIDAVDDNNEIKGTISAILAEATIDEVTFETLFVAGGSCFEIETASFDSGYEEPCVPQCEAGWECGSDGCGGTCGEGCGELACSEDHKCVEWECDKLEIGEAVISEYDYSYYAPVVDNAAGDTSLEDMIQLEFTYYYPAAGTFDLSLSYDDAYYAMFLLEDLVEDEDGYLSASKLYFQESGELEFTEVYDSSFESKGHASFRVVEVDAESLEPVAGGKCYDIENFTWDTVCVPNCKAEDGVTDKICGSDGCGGTCGEGCDGNTTCNAEQTSCVPYVCTEIELNLSEGFINSNDFYQTTYTPFTGDEALTDNFQIQLYSDIEYEYEYDLSGTNFEDCDLCLLVFEDVQSTTGSRNKEYFQQKGKITFATSGTNVKATLSDIRLEEVEIDWANETYVSVPVAGGSCLTIKDTTITYPASEE